MSMSPQSIVSKAVPTLIDGGVQLAGVAAGISAGSYLSNAINAAVPQANFPVGAVSFGLGDIVNLAAGITAGVYAAKGGNAMVKNFAKTFSISLAAGSIVNKAAQLAGLPVPFQSVIPATPAAFTQSRALFQGRVIPSSAYASRSYQLNVA